MVCDTVSQIFILEQAGIWNGAVCVLVHECLCEAASVGGVPGSLPVCIWKCELVSVTRRVSVPRETDLSI